MPGGDRERPEGCDAERVRQFAATLAVIFDECTRAVRERRASLTTAELDALSDLAEQCDRSAAELRQALLASTTASPVDGASPVEAWN